VVVVVGAVVEVVGATVVDVGRTLVVVGASVVADTDFGVLDVLVGAAVVVVAPRIVVVTGGRVVVVGVAPGDVVVGSAAVNARWWLANEPLVAQTEHATWEQSTVVVGRVNIRTTVIEPSNTAPSMMGSTVAGPQVSRLSTHSATRTE
jgi:hypothetical protein